jgi:hypothetical protein
LIPQRPDRSHATADRLPQMEREAQRSIWKRHSFDAFSRTKLTTQSMNFPWLFWLSQGQASERSASSAQRSAWHDADSSPLSPWCVAPFFEEASATSGVAVSSVISSPETARAWRVGVIPLPPSFVWAGSLDNSKVVVVRIADVLSEGHPAAPAALLVRVGFDCQGGNLSSEFVLCATGTLTIKSLARSQPWS